MSTSLSRSFRLSSTLKIEEEAMVITKNKGIGSILTAGTDCERSVKSSSSLRRTLSADMSSTKWLTQQGFSATKKIASSEEFSISSITDSSSSSSEGEEEEECDEERKETDSETEPQSQFDICSSIQEEVCKKEELEKPGPFDIWSSIISQKEQENNNESLPSAYIHPLVKRSASSLSEKSLEICTESLGSETGSDGFSSYPPSDTETGDADQDDKEMEQEQPLLQQQPQEKLTTPSFDFEELRIPKYNYVVGKKSPQRSFPPPIPSLSHRDGASIHMQSRRDNGRLVLEAVSVPSANNFYAQRQNGRLVLTFVNSYSTEQQVPKNEEGEEPKFNGFSAEQAPKKEEVDELEEEFLNFEEEEEQEEEEEEEEDRETEAEEETEEEGEEEEGENESRGEEEAEFVMEQTPKLASGVINVHRLTLTGLANRDPKWPKNFNEVVKFNEVEGDIKPTIVAQSLPPPPRMPRLIPKSPATAAATVVAASAGGASFNAYEYYWRPKPMISQKKGISNNNKNKFILSEESMDQNQQLLVLRGRKGEYLVPLVKSCKEPRRSLLFWEPYCIATS